MQTIIITAQIRGRYACDEYIARAILGARIGWSHSQVSCMMKRESFAPSTMKKLEEADRFFIESSDETLCCPYVPVSEADVLRLRPLIAGTSDMVQNMRDRFSVRGNRVYDKVNERYVIPSESQRIKSLIAPGKAWYRPFKAYYPCTELFGMERCSYPCRLGSGVRLALPVYERSSEDGRYKRRVVYSQARPADSAPLMAAYAAWLYKEAGLARPNKPITAIRPDKDLIQSIIEFVLAKRSNL